MAVADFFGAWLRPRHQQHNAAMATAIMASLAERGHLPGGLEGTWRAARTAATVAITKRQPIEMSCPARRSERSERRHRSHHRQRGSPLRRPTSAPIN